MEDEKAATELEWLRSGVAVAHQKVRDALPRYTKAQRELDDARKIYYERRTAYEKLDFELALIDGRYKKVTKNNKKKKEVKLSTEQVNEIATILGISLME